MVFAIEATRPLGNTGVQSLKVIRAADHHEAIVVFQPIDFVEEEGFELVGDEAVEVLEDEQARSGLSRFDEDFADGVEIVAATCEGFDVEGWDWVWAGGERMYQRFNANGFPVAGCLFEGALVFEYLI